jgi:hypothetical protein
MKVIKFSAIIVLFLLAVVATALLAHQVGFDKGVDAGERKGKDYILFFLSGPVPITLTADTGKGSQGWSHGSIQVESKRELDTSSKDMFIDFSLSPAYEGKQRLYTTVSKWSPHIWRIKE